MPQQQAPNVIRNIGLDLPVFDDIHMVYGSLYQAKIPDLDSFGRTIGLSSMARDLQLKQVLDIAAAEFKAINELCGTHTVPHQWGLLRQSDYLVSDAEPMYEGQHDDIPGYCLVAKVGRLITQPWQHDDVRLGEIQSGAKLYTNQRSTTWKLGDISLKQFRLANAESAEKTVAYLTDIDLWIY